jgi:hypothetical protein
MRLCINCLDLGAKAVNVGPEKGSQRDPYNETVDLCEQCERCLLTGDFGGLSFRYNSERLVQRQAPSSDLSVGLYGGGDK